MDSAGILAVIAAMSKKIEEEKDYLTELDNSTGDGDHGINMARGFAAVESKLPQLVDKDISTILKTVGMTLASVVAGTAGPLFGTVFMKAGGVMTGKSDMTLEDFIECMKAATDGVMMRGKAVKGEKTMLDSMLPALEAMENDYSKGLTGKEVLESGIKAAKEGLEFTKTIAATKGRASYIGARSIEYQDPGATSFTLLLEVIANECK